MAQKLAYVAYLDEEDIELVLQRLDFTEQEAQAAVDSMTQEQFEGLAEYVRDMLVSETHNALEDALLTHGWSK